MVMIMRVGLHPTTATALRWAGDKTNPSEQLLMELTQEVAPYQAKDRFLAVTKRALPKVEDGLAASVQYSDGELLTKMMDDMVANNTLTINEFGYFYKNSLRMFLQMTLPMRPLHS